jgi:hypothetical protein
MLPVNPGNLMSIPSSFFCCSSVIATHPAEVALVLPPSSYSLAALRATLPAVTSLIMPASVPRLYPVRVTVLPLASVQRRAGMLDENFP